MSHRSIDEDPDADLRSLLSGNSFSLGSGGNSLINPHRTKKQQAKNSKAVSSNSLARPRMDGHITLLDGTGSRNNSSDNSNSGTGGNDNNIDSGTVNESSSRAASPTEIMHLSQQQRTIPSGKRLLYLLGTALLLLAVFGPGGVLYGDHEPPSTSPHPFPIGDRHHSLNKVHPDVEADRRYSNIKATGSRKHEKFGSRNKQQKRIRDESAVEENGPIHSSIKEAINNIDKVFMGKAPRKKNLRKTDHDADEKRSSEETIKKNAAEKRNKQFAENESSNNLDDDTTFLQTLTATTVSNSIPIIHADDDTLPSNAEALDAYTNSLPASDALECRASVIAFVINATDVRDECEGLRKAFDKTCSVNSNVAASGTGGNVAGSSGSGSVVSARRRLKRWGIPSVMTRKWLIEKSDWSVSQWLWRMRFDLLARQSWISRWIRGDAEDAFLFAEEELATEAVWNEARAMVDIGVDLQALANDLMIYTKTPIHRHLMKSLDPNIPSEAGKSVISIVEERKAEDALTSEEEAPVPTKREEDTPKISLMIPTADEHMSDEMLNDALLLQEAKTIVDPKPLPVSQEATPQEKLQEPQDEPKPTVGNNTASEEAARDASESAEAIRTATEAVKNMMMDPKSVEARTCCASILSVFHEHCDPTTTGIEDYSDRKLLVIVFVVTVCGMVKSLIRFFNIRWLPEAGGCILVGVIGYLILQNVSYVQYAFDGDMFLRIMVPPIVFEAAVKINKRSFQRHVIPITIYAIVGTLLSTALTATILHKASSMVGWCPTIPIKESLIFGSLISSIDPIAVLSVLNNMGMTDSDTIYVLIFGESLLNDGIAIVLFQTLVHFLDESLVIDGEAVIDAIMHFVVVALGSLSVGVASGACATVYFALMHGCQTPMVELISFLAWAFIPYFICDMVEWSGIVAIVANGFVMDLYVVGQKHTQNISSVDDEIDFLVNGNGSISNGSIIITGNGNRGRPNAQQCRSFFNHEGHLSPLANNHVHFVIEIFATLMETAIFAYLGLFLFSPRYHWNGYLTVISIFATVMGRVIMIPILSHFSNIINRMIISRNNRNACIPRNDNNENVHVDRRMQLVLVFAGLRGAMSFALVEHIPLFDTITAQGSRLKPELKAMTSASIIFTVFVLGGATSYVMEKIGYSISPKQEHDAIEVAPLVRHSKPMTPNSAASKRKEIRASRDSMDRTRSSTSVRQRGSGGTR
ncbi:hypothetical protein HJC23_013306 [Cyclotella cryptica]|uniref:Cation/H+ exchanger transmembrane domain-containing protein n=1 Tax=Cyclotella cryptica TaxID=29204 RepID=A0ABD3Q1A6_9STRA|eukprot:CCRYP_009712-RA/>CCRYP_009712-RA protein AED:0.01 eAED:0.01 QI:285/1/1/1/1/1/2/2193/1208